MAYIMVSKMELNRSNNTQEVLRSEIHRTNDRLCTHFVRDDFQKRTWTLAKLWRRTITEHRSNRKELGTRTLHSAGYHT